MGAMGAMPSSEASVAAASGPCHTSIRSRVLQERLKKISAAGNETNAEVLAYSLAHTNA